MLKTNINKYDKTFSEYIRLRDGCCQRCGKGGRLECSHIFTRKHLSTRWDETNAKALCFRCHRWWHENPIEAVEWLKGIIGEDAYQKLRYRAKSCIKVTRWEKDHIRKKYQERIKNQEFSERFNAKIIQRADD